MQIPFGVLGKKGQGLPINTIILIAIGLLILVLFITFVLGGFKGISPVTSNNGLSGYASECEAACSEATSAPPYGWCTYGSIVASGVTYNCQNETSGPITCTYVMGNGTSVTYGSNEVGGDTAGLTAMKSPVGSCDYISTKSGLTP